MMEEEIMQEICENQKVEEEAEDKEDGDNENETEMKPKQQEIHQAIETFDNFSLSTESREIGTVALKVPSLIETELNYSMENVQNFVNKKSFTLVRPYFQNGR